jgi:hypothetical protein
MCVLAYDQSIQTSGTLWFDLLVGSIVEADYAETDAQGRYTLVVPPNRSYVIHLWDCIDGFYEYEWYLDRNAATSADPVPLGNGTVRVLSPVAFLPSGAIAGQVTDAGTGNPLEGIEVWTTDWSGYWLWWYGITDSDGMYYLQGLRGGSSHRVEFWDPNEDYQLEWWGDQSAIGTADPVTVHSGFYLPDLDAALDVDQGTFTDDNSSVFEDDIEWLAASGITRGCNPPVNDEYCPDRYVTRGQMAAFLTRALGLFVRLDDPFWDDDTSIFEADIEKLAAAGITRGCNPPLNDQFCPDRYVTRGQMAAFLTRALGYTDDGGGDLFRDDDGSVFERDIDCLGTAGVTRGCNPPVNDEYCPDRYVTRGQMAAFLHRALG